MSSEPPIVLRHSMFPPKISDKRILEALSEDQRRSDLAIVDIMPDFQPLERYDHSYPWEETAKRQKQLFDTSIEPLLSANPDRPIVYFGLAPIPFAFQLGMLVTHRHQLQIHQHHHVRSDWRWLPEVPARPRPLTVPMGDLGGDDSASEDLVVRVSASHHIRPVDTRVALSGRANTVHNIDLRVQDEPDPDFFEVKADLEEFCLEFGTLIDNLNKRYPAARTLHLFAAVTCGVAFGMGTRYSNTGKLKPVQTYQYNQHIEPRYAPALAFGNSDRASLLLLTADPVGLTPTSGLSEVKTIRDMFKPHHARIEVQVEPGLRSSDLQQLLDCHARILHFAGHGASTFGGGEGSRDLSCPDIEEPGGLVLLGGQGQRFILEHEDLLSIVKRGQPRELRCVVLSACHSADLARRLVHEANVEHAIGFTGAIDDQAARKFSLTFYRELLSRRIVEDAFNAGRLQIELEGRTGRNQARYYCRPEKTRTPLIY